MNQRMPAAVVITVVVVIAATVALLIWQQSPSTLTPTNQSIKPAPTSKLNTKTSLPLVIPPQDQWKTYVSADGLYQVKHLPDWSVREASPSPGQKGVIFASKDLTRQEMYKPIMGGEITLAVADARIVKQLAPALEQLKSFTAAQNTASVSASQIGSQKAIELVQPSTDLLSFTAQGNNVITISLSAEDKRFADFKKVYELTKQSFQFLK